MIFRVGNRTYTVQKREAVTFDSFVKLTALARLEDNLSRAVSELATAPDNQRYRQREKVKRLERQVEKAKETVRDLL